MEKYNFIIAMVIILGVCGAGFVFAFLKKKGIKVDAIIKDSQEVLQDAGTIIKAGQSISPNPIFTKLDLIDKLALTVVGGTQQLYISSQLPADQRKSKAKEEILKGLNAANIKDTAQLDSFIDMAIESAIYNSKTDTEKKNQEQNTLQLQINQLTTEKAQLQTSNTELVNKNTELTNKLNTVLSTVK
ncbi:bZIP transcription factor [Clostridium felsineum]|uniref:bZIP transcription factor n=1 Tax=Clostridium felsineum TaxID=36839 RepID=UPI00214D1A43|nr:bZIP transcription factor [Clostridium felsineum]MCR3760433.1 bZIP transcription factor [Clostridium felsineum]